MTRWNLGLALALGAVLAGCQSTDKTAVEQRNQELEKRVAELERQVAKVTARAERAEALVELQKKVAALLGRPFPSDES